MKNIKKINIMDIDDFKDHPFKVKQDESFKELKQSIKDHGLLEPLLVRPKNLIDMN